VGELFFTVSTEDASHGTQTRVAQVATDRSANGFGIEW